MNNCLSEWTPEEVTCGRWTKKNSHPDESGWPLTIACHIKNLTERL